MFRMKDWMQSNTIQGPWGVGLVMLVVAWIFWDGSASAQSCPPADLCSQSSGDDVVFYTTVEYYNEDPLAPRGVVQRHGPTRGFTGGPARAEGDGTTTVRRESQVSGSASTGAFTVDIRNLVRVRNRLDQSLFIEGNGVTVSVDVYMKVPAGTPWVITRQASGQLTTAFPTGSGRSDAFYGAFSCSYNCGQSFTEQPSTTRGITTNQRPSDLHGCYSKAGTISFDTNGWIFQSLSFCFPFGCSEATYLAESVVNASMTIGVDLPCTGTVSQTWLTDCSRVPGQLGMGVYRAFEVTANFQGLNGNPCDCCEYRQYLRRSRTLIGIPYLPFGLWESDEGQNGLGYDRDCEEWIEDNGRYPSSTCTFPGYGHRMPGCNGGSNDDYGPNRTSSCTYRAFDDPSSLTGTKKYVEFEGRVVLRPGCGPNPAGSEYIIARQSWVYCCEQNLLSTVECRDRSVPSIVRPGVASPYFDLGDRSARVRVGRVGRVFVGAVEFPLGDGEMFEANDFPVAVDGLAMLPNTQTDLSVTSSGTGSVGLRFFAFTSTCSPPRITVRSGLTPLGPGAVATTTVDLAPIARALADLDDGTMSGMPDGGVTVDDLLYYLAQYTQGSVRADSDDGSGLGLPDGGVTIEDLLFYLDQYAAGC